MSTPPPNVIEIAERRAAARADNDFEAADRLRHELAEAGWDVYDTPAGGFELTERPRYEIWPSVRSIPVSSIVAGRPPGDPDPKSTVPYPGSITETALNDAGVPSMAASQALWDGALATSRVDRQIDIPKLTASVALLADGWPADVRACVSAVLAHSDAGVIALDLGNVDGAGDALHELAEAHPDRVRVWHVAEKPHWRGGTAEWGPARTKLLQLDTADVHVVMETSTILEGDAIRPLLRALEVPDVVGAGWKGVEPEPGGTEWHDAGAGEVTALLGYLFAVNRAKALRVGGFPEHARFYRNADLEFSLMLPGRLVVPEKDLPVRQARHRGYFDTEAGYRDEESKRTYDRVLDLLRR
ncbi:hypothetical protein GT755_26405 [Herbidospora sp. NEAU-GS84]|uniref:Uncharacterized protein n=1 Tax=Herbidospora solisilvae TaxID=2696284 RepID=A0A7C9J6K3_9ACTN|nr:hypothetical protein [Herbidospora solisilvae]NAS25200.1 hypothetical protein [Herbidospora solisilvae]